MNKSVLAICAVAVCMLAIGCEPGSSNPPTSPVTGKITYKGEAVDGAKVKFVPVDPEGKVANGESGADGTYTMSTFETGDGAMNGKYKVSVRKLVSVQEGVQQDGEFKGEPAFVNKDMLPKKYISDANTPLEFEVKEGDNTYDIELTD